MRTRISKIRHMTRSVVLGVLGLSMTLAAHAEGSHRGCPASASIVASAGKEFRVAPGFTVRRIVTDRMLHQTWAIVEDCSHPERPLEMIQLGAPISPAKVEPTQAAAPAIPVAVAQSVPAIAARSPQIAVSEPVSSSVPAPFSSAALLPQPLLVRAGDRVHLWSASTNVRLEIEAVALDYGHAGQVIHLRRMGSDPSRRVMLAGLVDGADSAELLP